MRTSIQQYSPEKNQFLWYTTKEKREENIVLSDRDENSTKSRPNLKYQSWKELNPLRFHLAQFEYTAILKSQRRGLLIYFSKSNMGTHNF